jgi:hypothetical protein
VKESPAAEKRIAQAVASGTGTEHTRSVDIHQ